MKKSIYLATILLMSLTMINCGNDSKTSPNEDNSAIAVKISSVETNNGTPFLTSSGKVKAVNSANLSTRMMGFVNKVYVKVGDKVSYNQLLISINNSDLQAKKAQVSASISEATAAYNNAEKDYTRFKNLFAETSVSQKEMDDMTANYEMAKARLEAANQMKKEINAQFTYANIRAPFNGVITNKFIEEGDMANPGIPLIAVESPGKFEVATMVPESEISQIKSGTKVDVLIKSINKTVQGKVAEVSTSAKNTGGQYFVKVVLDKTDANILSGMYTTVKFPVENTVQSSRILIPKGVIIMNGDLTGIYTVSQQNTAMLRWLRLGKTYGDMVEVLSGLKEGERYITSAEGKIFNGAKIEIQ